MKKVVILNGPPGCGKDTLSDYISSAVGFEQMSMKKPMFDIALSMLGEKKFAEFMKLYNDRETKEMPCDLLGGMSPREFMIHISESFVKPILGKCHFGHLAAEEISKSIAPVIFSDGGFPDEVMAIADSDFPEVEIILIRLHREGFDFSGDSRNYIYLHDELHCSANYREVDIHLSEGEISSDAATILDAIFY